MRILIDLGHPAHVHYFRNFISKMKELGHEFALVARDKEVLHRLLDAYKLPYTSRGRGGKGLVGKVLYILKADLIMWNVARKFKPDLFLSFASTYAAHAAALSRKPHIALDDTEHAAFELFMYPPFTRVIINPSSFTKRFSSKQLFLPTFFELSYLHPRYFTPDPHVLEAYGITTGSPFFILRFVSWDASHDRGASGLSAGAKLSVARKLAEHGKVIISSEANLPPELQKFQAKIFPEHLHHLLAYCALYIGEGATTASECVALGTPAIYVNSLNAGTLQEQADKYGLHNLRNDEGLDSLVKRILREPAVTAGIMAAKKKQLLIDKIDPTSFLVWFINGFPKSLHEVRLNPEIIKNFKYST